MKNFRSRLAAFFYRNQNKGIPFLMLFISVGNLVVYFLTRANPDNPLLYNVLSFDAGKILQGQVWRILTYVFVYLCQTGGFWGFLSMVFYTLFGRQLEQAWGTLRFNLYYLTGVLLTALGGLILGSFAQLSVSAYYVNLSIFLALATLEPDMQVRIFFVLPLKMKWVAWLDLGFLLFNMVEELFALTIPLARLGIWDFSFLLPIIALGNWVLFFGKNLKWLLPDPWLRKLNSRKAEQKYPSWVRGGGSARKNYRFKCTVCGRTDASNPGLEFRYCSKCSGYRCYCIDHINNHPHILDGGQDDA